MVEEKQKGKKNAFKTFDHLEDVPMGVLPAHLEEQRTRVLCDMDAPKHTHAVQYGGAYVASGIDHGLRISEFQKNFRVEVISIKGEDMIFDMIGIDAAIANAFRRILISEVPTMAIEKVFIANNTSIIQDEVLSHRLGLVPLKVDPRNFEYMTTDGVANEKNTLVFKLNQKCERVADRVEGASVLSGALEWCPEGSNYPPNQQKKFTSFGSSQLSLPEFESNPPRPTYDDIILAKMRPRQAIELEVHAVKGAGKTHAKWSPVATAAYRMLPEVILKKQIKGELADQLVAKCPVGVFDIEDLGTGIRAARAAYPRKCTLCRECIREEGWDELVQLRRKRDHFIFSIEGTGALPPNELFVEAVKILEDKVQRIASEL